eukprot:COSAG02_NODE_2559_length_8529_cov_5.446382_9_plen_188_part_01
MGEVSDIIETGDAALSNNGSTQRFVNASCANTPCSAFDIGLSIGKLQKETIAKMFDVRLGFYRKSDHNHKLAAWPKYANMSLPTLEKYAPTTLEEMKGVATGAELPLTTLLQLATDYENGLWLKGVTGQPVGATMPTKACTATGKFRSLSFESGGRHRSWRNYASSIELGLVLRRNGILETSRGGWR